jgi:putative protein kinase ArgK-like GTPase of G3E family
MKSSLGGRLAFLLVGLVSIMAIAQENARFRPPKNIEITETLVKKYLKHVRQKLKSLQEHAKEIAQTESAKNAGINELSKKLYAKLEILRNNAGITKETEQILDDLAFSIISAKLILQTNNVDLKELKESLPPEEQAQSEKFFKDMRAAQIEVASLKEIRKKYGDKAVNIFIRHDQELMEIHSELAKLMIPSK